MNLWIILTIALIILKIIGYPISMWIILLSPFTGILLAVILIILSWIIGICLLGIAWIIGICLLGIAKILDIIGMKIRLRRQATEKLERDIINLTKGS